MTMNNQGRPTKASDAMETNVNTFTGNKALMMQTDAVVIGQDLSLVRLGSWPQLLATVAVAQALREPVGDACPDDLAGVDTTALDLLGQQSPHDHGTQIQLLRGLVGFRRQQRDWYLRGKGTQLPGINPLGTDAGYDTGLRHRWLGATAHQPAQRQQGDQNLFEVTLCPAQQHQ